MEKPLTVLLLRIVLTSLMAALTSGCITTAGDSLSDISPAPPAKSARIEQSVGGFSFHLVGGKMVTSNKMGRTVNDELLKRWKKRGYISSHIYVPSEEFTGKADYNLSLGGHQEGDSSAVLQFFSGLTLFLLPYYVNTKMDLTYSLEHVASGSTFEAAASDSFNTIVGLILLPISPFFQGGRGRTWDRLANHLYEQLSEQGAFDTESLPTERPAAEVEPEPPTEAERRLEELRVLHSKGLISDNEYEEKRSVIIEGL